jgi:hypothetical protein
MQARWPREQVRIEGDATEYVRISDEGEERSFFFCPRCGSTVYFWPDPEHIAVPVGVRRPELPRTARLGVGGPHARVGRPARRDRAHRVSPSRYSRRLPTGGSPSPSRSPISRRAHETVEMFLLDGSPACPIHPQPEIESWAPFSNIPTHYLSASTASRSGTRGDDVADPSASIVEFQKVERLVSMSPDRLSYEGVNVGLCCNVDSREVDGDLLASFEGGLFCLSSTGPRPQHRGATESARGRFGGAH